MIPILDEEAGGIEVDEKPFVHVEVEGVGYAADVLGIYGLIFGKNKSGAGVCVNLFEVEARRCCCCCKAGAEKSA